MGFKMGGSQSKDTDQTLTSMIQDATGVKWIYVPFQGGSAAAVQLAGGHIDSNVNNPNENIGQWKAGQVKPLCVFSPVRLAKSEPVFEGKGWGDIPTCKEAGLPLETFQMPRTVWLPAERSGRRRDLLCRPAGEGRQDAGMAGIRRSAPSQTGQVHEGQGARRLRRQGRGREQEGLRERRLGREVRPDRAT